MERFQLVKNTSFRDEGVPHYMILEVECEDNNPNIIRCPLDIIPVQITGDSPKDVKELLQVIYEDVMKYPIVTTDELENIYMDYMASGELQFEMEFPEEKYEVEAYTRGIVYEDEEDEKEVTMYDSSNVIDIVDYFNKNNRGGKR